MSSNYGKKMKTCCVCEASTGIPFQQIDGRHYWRCQHCQATWLDSQHHLCAQAELAEYQLHENNLHDSGYRDFLTRISEPLQNRLQPGAEGLDFGCGPGPLLAQMLEEAGFRMHKYDPYFHPERATLAREYDFVTCTEVAEHFYAPAQEFALLRSLVRPGGWLALMTCFQTDDRRFANWSYRRDPTHVVFYKAETFMTLAQMWGWQCEIPRKDVVLLQKPRTESPS